MIDFSPLLKTLKERGIKVSDLYDEVASARTITKMVQNKNVNLDTVDKLCLHLGVPIEKVVRILLDNNKE